VSKAKTLALTTLITAVLAAGAFVVYDDIDPDVEVKKTAIEKVRIEFRGKSIYLNVFLNQPQTCNQVITELGVEQLPVKSKIYVPACTIIKDDYIKIVFEEKITV
jgi:hypothetical protein